MKKMLELRKGNYVAIIDNERLIEIEAESAKEAKAKYEHLCGKSSKISICRVPDCITIIG